MNGFYCHSCMRSFEELDLWGHTKWCGDHYKCTSCNADISRDVTLEESSRLAKMIWNAGSKKEDFDDGWNADGW